MVKSEKIKNIKAVYISIENNKIFIYLFIQNGFYLYNSEIKATDFQLFFDAIPSNENYFDLQKDIDFIYDKLIEIYPKPNKYFYQISNSNSDKYIRKFKRKFKFSHKLKN